MSSNVEIVARVYRGKAVEAVHYGSIAVVNSEGKLTHCVGDPGFVTVTRSCIKPFQIIPLLETGAADELGFSSRQLAIVCGSHSGTDEHKMVVFSNLELARCTPGDLKCGTRWPLGMMMRQVFPTDGEEDDPLRHFCSGKHSGFLALAGFLGDDKADYLNPDSKAQQMVKKAVSDFCEYPLDRMPTTIDGCSAPNYPLALHHVALGFKKLANLDTADATFIQVLGRIKGAMSSYPEMVSGEGRFDLALMRSFPDNVVCKVGAESIEGIGFSDPPLGIAVKIHDGNDRALGAVCVEVLRQLGIIRNIDDVGHLKTYSRPEIRNDRGIVTGGIVPEFNLRRIT